MYYHDTGTVALVEHGAVVILVNESAHIIDGAEAWRKGDKIECIVSNRGTETILDDQIVHTWYNWRRDTHGEENAE